ncbi:hypothetical protein BSKO_12243 [Bryopsis sp. KO-2023]|nr:hypothetical protein BSKO_12243 [Bryopsis sp. KO-2023]
MAEEEQRTDWMRRNLVGLPVFVREMLAGGLAGMVGKTSVAPLERVKILFQTGRMPGTSVFHTLSLLLKKEGFLGLYKGNGASVVRIIPYSALHFHAYEINRRFLVESPPLLSLLGTNSSAPSTLVDLFAGAGAGATAVMVTYPLDLVRTRLACMSEVRENHGLAKQWTWAERLTIREVVADVLKKEGVLGLYRGVGPTLLGILPYAGLKFYIYQTLKQRYRLSRGDPIESNPKRKSHLPIPVMLAFGGIAGLIGQTAVYPLDVVRRRMQVPSHSSGFLPVSKNTHHRAPPVETYRSTWDGLGKIARSGGFRSLFAGLSINYMKVIPSTAIGFTVYDALKHYLQLEGNL